MTLRAWMIAHFRGHDIIEHVVTDDRIASTVGDFSVHEIAPGPACSWWTYVTDGCARVGSGANYEVEFVHAAGGANAWCLENLTMTAHYYANPPRSSPRGLWLGDTFPQGGPVVEGSRLDHY